MNITIEECIDVIFSHNEIVSIWKPCSDENASVREWRGMAHEIPDKYLNCTDWKIFGTISENISESSDINIRVMLYAAN